MIFRCLSLLAAALLLPQLLLATPLADKVVEHRLANGLRLLMVERHDTPTVAAYITIGVGSVPNAVGFDGTNTGSRTSSRTACRRSCRSDLNRGRDRRSE